MAPVCVSPAPFSSSAWYETYGFERLLLSEVKKYASPVSHKVVHEHAVCRINPSLHCSHVHCSPEFSYERKISFLGAPKKLEFRNEISYECQNHANVSDGIEKDSAAERKHIIEKLVMHLRGIEQFNDEITFLENNSLNDVNVDPDHISNLSDNETEDDGIEKHSTAKYTYMIEKRLMRLRMRKQFNEEMRILKSISLNDANVDPDHISNLSDNKTEDDGIEKHSTAKYKYMIEKRLMRLRMRKQFNEEMRLLKSISLNDTNVDPDHISNLSDNETEDDGIEKHSTAKYKYMIEKRLMRLRMRKQFNEEMRILKSISLNGANVDPDHISNLSDNKTEDDGIEKHSTAKYKYMIEKRLMRLRMRKQFNEEMRLLKSISLNDTNVDPDHISNLSDNETEDDGIEKHSTAKYKYMIEKRLMRLRMRKQFNEEMRILKSISLNDPNVDPDHISNLSDNETEDGIKKHSTAKYKYMIEKRLMCLRMREQLNEEIRILKSISLNDTNVDPDHISNLLDNDTEDETSSLDKLNKLYGSYKDITCNEFYASKFDLPYKLRERNLASILSYILSCLSDEDLRNFKNVSQAWREIISSDRIAKARLKAYITKKKDLAIGSQKENKFGKRTPERSHKSTFFALTNSPVEVSPQPSPISQSPGRFDCFIEEVRKLQKGEMMMKCPKCGYPSRAESENKYCCSRSLCQYIFCSTCLSPQQNDHLCSRSDFNAVLSNVKIGSKQTKKNLRRL